MTNDIFNSQNSCFIVSGTCHDKNTFFVVLNIIRKIILMIKNYNLTRVFVSDRSHGAIAQW